MLAGRRQRQIQHASKEPPCRPTNHPGSHGARRLCWVIATMNVLSPSHAHWPVRRPLLKECLSRLEADVYALQEIDATGTPDAAGKLIGPGYYIVRHNRRALTARLLWLLPDGPWACFMSWTRMFRHAPLLTAGTRL